MNPGNTYIPFAIISFPPFLSLGLFDSSISTPGYPTTSIEVILLFSTLISTGPTGGAPFPLIKVAPRIIK